MNSSIRQRFTGAVAAAAASVVTLGLVSAPPQRYEPLITRTEFAAIQLQAAVSTQVAALASATATAPPAAAAAETLTDTPQASLSFNGGGLNAIATTALTLALTPLWYLAFPVTLPVAVIGGVILLNGLGSIPFASIFSVLDPITATLVGAVLGLGAFAVGPLGLIAGSLQSVFNNPLVSAAAQLPASAADSTPAAVPQTTDAVSQAAAAAPNTRTAAAELVGSRGKATRVAAQRQTAIAAPASAARAATAVAGPSTKVNDNSVSTPPAGTQVESSRPTGTPRANRSESARRDNARVAERRGTQS